MCLYPKLIENPKFKKNKKNKGIPPVCTDERLLFVTASCGQCYECRQQKQRQWLVRMQEQLKDTPNAIFVTLTINDENLTKLKKEFPKADENDIAKICIRRYLERIRKKTGKSQKHWYTTEIGGNNTERLHLHGIEWSETAEFHTECWQYGFVFIGEYVSEQTINYVTKYMTKIDPKHRDYIPKVFCSAGIGAGYMKRASVDSNRFKDKNTNETYKCKNGAVVNLPIYYRNKIYTEEEREKLWKQKLDKGIVYICGEKTRVDSKEHRRLLNYYQDKYRKLCSESVEEWEWQRYRRRLKKQRDYYEREYKRIERKRREVQEKEDTDARR